jgi:hypothetical protein
MAGLLLGHGLGHMQVLVEVVGWCVEEVCSYSQVVEVEELFLEEVCSYLQEGVGVRNHLQAEDEGCIWMGVGLLASALALLVVVY